MKTSPAYQWYVKDAMSDERYVLLTLEQRGAYRDLLDLQWIQGSIPSDIDDLARLLRTDSATMAAIWRAVGSFFAEVAGSPGRLANRRLERERENIESQRRKKSEAGKKGAESRWSGRKRRTNQTRSRSESTEVANGTATRSPLANDGSADCGLQTASPPTPPGGQGSPAGSDQTADATSTPPGPDPSVDDLNAVTGVLRRVGVRFRPEGVADSFLRDGGTPAVARRLAEHAEATGVGAGGLVRWLCDRDGQQSWRSVLLDAGEREKLKGIDRARECPDPQPPQSSLSAVLQAARPNSMETTAKPRQQQIAAEEVGPVFGECQHG